MILRAFGRSGIGSPPKQSEATTKPKRDTCQANINIFFAVSRGASTAAAKLQRHKLHRRRLSFSKEQVDYIVAEHDKLTHCGPYMASKQALKKLWRKGIREDVLSKFHTLEGVRSVARRHVRKNCADVAAAAADPDLNAD